MVKNVFCFIPFYFLDLIKFKKMKNKVIILTVVLLIISVANFFIYTPELNIRNVDMLTILAIGFLAGILIMLLLGSGRNK